MESKVFCFVFMGNLYLCPYITKYLEHIDYPYDIIYWNRDGIKEDMGARKVYSFEYDLNNVNTKYKKLKGYWYFKKYATKILRKNRYDGVIVLQTIAGVILQRILSKTYFKKFILDVRDYTLEKNKIFYYIEKKVINASAITVISSEGYKDFLPPYNYFLTHNNRTLDKTMVSKIKNRSKLSNKLVIAFIGYISYQDQHKKLMLKMKNHPNFTLSFIGKEANALKKFCDENNIHNVKIQDKFPPEEILSHYQGVNFINNLYGNGTPILDYALSNKLYFAAQLHIPILVCPGTYMAEVSKKYNFGYELDLDDDDIANKLLNYYGSIDWEILSSGCDEFMKKVKADNEAFVKKINDLSR